MDVVFLVIELGSFLNRYPLGSAMTIFKITVQNRQQEKSYKAVGLRPHYSLYTQHYSLGYIVAPNRLSKDNSTKTTKKMFPQRSLLINAKKLESTTEHGIAKNSSSSPFCGRKKADTRMPTNRIHQKITFTTNIFCLMPPERKRMALNSSITNKNPM